jgi:hypothetical protein
MASSLISSAQEYIVTNIPQPEKTIRILNYFFKFIYYSVWDTFLLTAHERRVCLNQMYTGY